MPRLLSHARISRVRHILPDVATAASSKEVVMMRFAPSALLRGRHRPRFTCLQVPAQKGAVTVVTPKVIARAHAMGAQVHVWTIDDAAEMHGCLTWESTES
ncbi:glycerophosphodiester phosphodiesterase family protein [Aeromicrobium sp. UC242_57]|uniref:glycerophosphodiester phosphodiesterase family protein n=1 Tax=Aeromicrobium sp. UC242_57 TaxID=3374624 RepID=UPI0037AC9954